MRRPRWLRDGRCQDRAWPGRRSQASDERRRPMTPDQVSGVFDFGEAFIEGTIGAALVALWLLAVALYMARPYMARNVHKFTLRLGADLWWIIYVALRDIFLIQ